jgi:hypothetical protein
MTYSQFTVVWPAPTSRSLHLVDIENLMGGPAFTVEDAADLVGEYAPVAELGPKDLTVVASSHYAAYAAWFGWPNARRLVKSGRDGADLALADVMLNEDICRRFERVVVGSGDGIFAHPSAWLQANGCSVTVVCRPGSLSRELAFAVRDVRFLRVHRLTPDVARRYTA